MPPVATGTLDPVRALAWTSGIERGSTALRPTRGLARYRKRWFLHDDLMALSVEFDAAGDFPAKGIFGSLPAGTSMLGKEGRSLTRSPTAVDIILAGANRTPELLRYRSFYLSGPRREHPLSMAVHQRLRADLPSPMVAGVRVQAALVGQTPFAVPRLLETGLAEVGLTGRQPADWLVEEVLDGTRIAMARAADLAPEVIGLLVETWQRLGVEHASLDDAQRARSRSAFTDLVERPPAHTWPIDVDRRRVWLQVQCLLDDPRPLTVGLCHGDPGLNNVLRLADGRLALVDWEHAGRRPIATDLLKVVRSTGRPLSLLPHLKLPAVLRASCDAAGAMPWSRQLALAVVLFQQGWRRRHERALARGRPDVIEVKMQTMLRMVAQLLDEG